ncbi:MAG: amidase [Pseudomonadota bacterium]
MGARERLDSALQAIAARNAEWRIVTALDEDGARAAAGQSDARRAAGQSLGPLDGALVAVKDNIAVAGLPWTAGLAHWKGRIAARDAEAVSRLRRAGAVILGTVNMHEGALGATTDNPVYGRCANPRDPARTPGGSSGGSAAVISAGWADAALGTDTMGSVRIPAAYCGVFGLKPTIGAVPHDGLTALSPSLDTIGPLARNLPLLSAMQNVLADPPGRASGPARLAEVVGLPVQLSQVTLEPEIATAYKRAQIAAEALGLAIRPIDLTGWEPDRARRGGLMLTEAEGAVALADAMQSQEGMSATLRALLQFGADLSSARLVEALARIRRSARAADRAFGEVDLLMMPTAPQRAFPHGRDAPANQADLTALANFAGLPALSLPVGAEGLPAAVQLVGPRHAEAQLLDVAARLAPILHVKGSP